MDPKKPLLSGLAATIVGTIGTIAAGASIFLPPPWSLVVAIAGFLCATLAGLAVKAPTVTEGKPVLQGAALAIATTGFGLLSQFYTLIPEGWPQGIALAVAALLAWLTGKALPPLGASSATVAAAVTAGATASAAVDDKAAAVATLTDGPAK